jgi:ABC-type phosphate transport system auxiliary subunit
LLKKNFKGGYISDDGFIIGLAFLMEILEQKKELKGIHWFSEVQKRLRAEVTELTEKTKKIAKQNAEIDEEFRDDECIELGLYLRQKKGFLEEFDLLENGFKAAHILFRDTSQKETNFYLSNDEA